MKRIIKYFIFMMFLLFCFGFKNALALTYPFNGIIHADSLVVYETNNSAGAKVTELAYGTRIKVLESVSNTKGSCPLYKVQYDGDKIGYTCSKYRSYSTEYYVDNVDERTTTVDVPGMESYNDYCGMLGQQGFPESYCPYLYYLHSKHPQWKFKADLTLQSLNSASYNQEYRSCLQTNNSNYWLTSEACDYGGYYYINGSVAASFMDPRNSLFEERIFQFFDSDDNKDLISDNTLNYIVGDGYLKQFLPAFKEAASRNGVNAVQLVARSKQEGNNTYGYQSSSGTSGFTYNGNSLNGYYNFYNINATGSNPILNGLVYAAGGFDPNVTTFQRPWNTPEKAISGGAEFIASSYIKNGQDTNYYQKFNVSSYRKIDGLYHQYMTNIHAPAGESISMYATYRDSNSLEQEFVFTIPVYTDMGNIYQPINKNPNAKLSSIMINGNLINNFDPEVIEYPYSLLNNDGGFTVSATAQESTTTIAGTGNYTFNNGVAIVKVSGTAEDGTVKTYTITVTQVTYSNDTKVADVIAKMDVKINENIMYGISPNTTVATIVSEAAKNQGVATVVNKDGNVKSEGNLATGDKITVKTNIDSVTYTVSIRGDATGDGAIDIRDFVLCQSHILGKNILYNEYFESVDVNYDGVVDIRDFVLIQSHILGKLTL